MKNILLGAIATCLILITGKMYLVNMQTAMADINGIDLKPFVHVACYYSHATMGSQFVSEPAVEKCYQAAIDKLGEQQ